jgi:hypothetical protein
MNECQRVPYQYKASLRYRCITSHDGGMSVQRKLAVFIYDVSDLTKPSQA